MKRAIYLLNGGLCLLLCWITISFQHYADPGNFVVRYLPSERGTKEKSTLRKFSYIDPDHCFKPLYARVSIHDTLLGEDKDKPINNPPVVKIIAPENNSFFQWNSQVSYTIQVRDAEDGDSDQLEIASNEVFLEVVYLSDSSKASDYIKNSPNSHSESPGFLLLKRADCFNCHAMKSRIQGPSFFEIAKRYAHTASMVKMLAERVIEGSSGIWGISAMASHPELTEEQASQIIEWIFKNADDPDKDYFSGTKGIFPTGAKPERQTGGVYILTASYTDHGSPETPHITNNGTHTIVLHNK